MDGPLICSSMRERPDWASLVPALLQNDIHTGRWKEASLKTHDVALPLRFSLSSRSYQPHQSHTSHSVFRVIFLSPSDVGSSETRGRIERLFNLNGGQYVAIVLLMAQHGQEGAPAVLMRLQLELVGGLEMPIIPVSSVETVSTTLWGIHHQLGASAASRRPSDSARSILPYFSGSQKLSEHAVNILTDITVGVKDLSEKAMTVEGQQQLTGYLGNDAKRIITFWNEEHTVD